MTLIAAFRTNDYGIPGVVMCADTQETRGDFSVPVKKIAIQDSASSHYGLVVGGAGEIGELIDDFTETLGQAVLDLPAGLGEQALRLKIKRLLVEFNRNEVAHYQTPYDKRLEFIICIRDKDTNEIHLWKTSGTGMWGVPDFALAGIGEDFYKPLVTRLYGSGITMAQAVLLGIHVLSQAGETITSIGGPSQLITVRMFGMTLVESSHVKALEQRTTIFNEALGKLVLACPDLSIRNDEFRALLADFEMRVMQLREQYFEVAASELLDRPYDAVPYPIVPGGMLVRGDDGKPELIPHEQVEAFMASLPAAKKLRDKVKEQQSAKKKQRQPSKQRKSKGQP